MRDNVIPCTVSLLHQDEQECAGDDGRLYQTLVGGSSDRRDDAIKTTRYIEYVPNPSDNPFRDEAVPTDKYGGPHGERGGTDTSSTLGVYAQWPQSGDRGNFASRGVNRNDGLRPGDQAYFDDGITSQSLCGQFRDKGNFSTHEENHNHGLRPGDQAYLNHGRTSLSPCGQFADRGYSPTCGVNRNQGPSLENQACRHDGRNTSTDPHGWKCPIQDRFVQGAYVERSESPAHHGCTEDISSRERLAELSYKQFVPVSNQAEPIQGMYVLSVIRPTMVFTKILCYRFFRLNQTKTQYNHR